jgi:N-glycosylase/DNA lyase
MKALLESVEHLKKSSIKRLIDKRIKEFEDNGEKLEEGIFSELCFCILTANFNAEKCIRIQKETGRGFLILPEKELERILREFGYRYPKTRARYIIEARECVNKLKDAMKLSAIEAREWLVKNVKGLGYKEASHFLRNIGYKDIAIIDFHIIDLLTKNRLIEKPKTITRKKYLEIEKLLEKIARILNLNLAELDLYLWYIETGKILK